MIHGWAQVWCGVGGSEEKRTISRHHLKLRPTGFPYSLPMEWEKKEGGKFKVLSLSDLSRIGMPLIEKGKNDRKGWYVAGEGTYNKSSVWNMLSLRSPIGHPRGKVKQATRYKALQLWEVQAGDVNLRVLAHRGIQGNEVAWDHLRSKFRQKKKKQIPGLGAGLLQHIEVREIRRNQQNQLGSCKQKWHQAGYIYPENHVKKRFQQKCN